MGTVKVVSMERASELLPMRKSVSSSTTYSAGVWEMGMGLKDGERVTTTSTRLSWGQMGAILRGMGRIVAPSSSSRGRNS